MATIKLYISSLIACHSLRLNIDQICNVSSLCTICIDSPVYLQTGSGCQCA